MRRGLPSSLTALPTRQGLEARGLKIVRNEIDLGDGETYYRRLNRTLDDSLAHELVHYIQARYFNDDLCLRFERGSCRRRPDLVSRNLHAPVSAGMVARERINEVRRGLRTRRAPDYACHSKVSRWRLYALTLLHPGTRTLTET